MLEEDASEEERDHADSQMSNCYGGILNNRLRRINPIHNARFDYVERAKAYFKAKR